MEETGDKRNFVVQAADVLDDGAEPRFGHQLISRGGVVYEGCTQWRNGQYWFCDYQTREPVSRQHYQANGWVLKVLWKWARYTGDQVSCSLALSGVWSGLKGKGFLLLLNDCKNGPMEGG